MTPSEWLCARAPGFKELSPEERAAIMDFLFLWSFFEAKSLNTKANATAICAEVEKWEASGQLKLDAFSESLTYFKTRHFQNGAFTDHFRDLRFRGNDHQFLVEGVLNGTNTKLADSISALLIVVWRLRNNLFHGIKWAYGIRDQQANFTHASAALMKAIELSEKA